MTENLKNFTNFFELKQDHRQHAVTSQNHAK